MTSSSKSAASKSAVRVKTGLDVLVEEGFKRLHGSTVAVLANQATVDSRIQHLVDLLFAESKIKLKKIFAPEHGFRGALQDMEHVGDTLDSKTGLPIISLYGSKEDSLTPTAEQLAGIDTIIVDLPDVGARYYTFAQSLAYTMRAAAKQKIRVVVLDRPNPLGDTVEGSPLLAACRSFCGLLSTPNRHGMTMGELAQMFNRGFGEGAEALAPIEANLEIVEMRSYKSSEYFDSTGLPWVLPSPNMPTLDTAIVYPGACLFECTNISEGRGTTRPFELLGAPFIDGEKWASALLQQGLALKGAMLRPTSFVPKFQKWANQTCGGVQIHVTDRNEFQPYRWGLALIASLKGLYPQQFQWRRDAYEFVDKVPAIDLLYGSSKFREAVDNGATLSSLESEISAFESSYLKARKSYRLYD